MAKITAKTFVALLREAVKAFGAVRDQIQRLCLFAMTQAGNGNFTYINGMLNADLKGADLRAIQHYFEDHCDVTLGKKDGKFAFTNNNTKGFKYAAPKKSWWDYKPTAAPQVIDPVAALIQAATRLDNAVKGKGSATIATGKLTLAKELVTYIRKEGHIAKGIREAAKAA